MIMNKKSIITMMLALVTMTGLALTARFYELMMASVLAISA